MRVGGLGLATVASLLWACLLMSACEARGPARTAAPEGERIRLADGRRLYLHCLGQGAPTVILDAGYGGTSKAWVKVQPEVAKTHRVCAYDRPGYGLSDPGPMPRDGEAVARDLDHALRRARVGGPFIVVGHSAGALYMRLFAERRPRDVVGMVLVDPSVEHQNLRFAAVFGAGAGDLTKQRDRAQRCLDAAERGDLPSSDPILAPCASPAKPGAPPTKINKDLFRTQISELDTLWGATSDEIDAGRQDYGDMPLIVLTADGTYAGLPQPARQAAGRLWLALHAELAARSRRGQPRLVTGSSHMMIFDQPKAIIAAIHEVSAQAAATPSR